MIKKYFTALKAAVFLLTANSLVAISPAAQAENYSVKPVPSNTLQETRPFNNMLRKMVLLTEEVVTEKQTPADAAKSKEETAKATPSAENNQNNSSSQSSTSNKTPDPQTTAGSKPIPSSPDAKELELPDLKDPEIPEKPGENKLSTQSVTAPSQNEDGLINKFFNNLQKNANQGNNNTNTNSPARQVTLSDEEVRKIIARKKAKKNSTPEPVRIEQKKSSEPSPVSRPNSNYRTQLLSNEVSKKSYTKENQHLPYAVYNEEYKKILFDSAAIGNLDILRAMVDDFGDTEVTDEEGNTPLIYASMAGNIESIITLFSLGANLNARNSNGVSALYAATKLGRLDIVQFLLQRMADPELPDNNDKTPLMVASEADFSRTAELLLKQNIDPNRKMRNGNTAIHFAAQNNSTSTLNLLISKGANVDLKNFKGYTPLMIAVENNYAQAASILIDAGADLTRTTAQGVSISNMASANPTISTLIESEKTKRELLSQQIAPAKAEPVKSEITFMPADIVAQRIDGIPIPVLKPSNPLKISPPKPLFTKEELEQMQKPEL